MIATNVPIKRWTNHWRVLLVMKATNFKRPCSYARFLNLHYGAVASALNELVRKGLVQRTHRGLYMLVPGATWRTRA